MTAPQQWEYLIVRSEQLVLKGGYLAQVPHTDRISILNKYGIEGWELIQVLATVETVYGGYGVVNEIQPKKVEYYFKRPLQPLAEPELPQQSPNHPDQF